MHWVGVRKVNDTCRQFPFGDPRKAFSKSAPVNNNFLKRGNNRPDHLSGRLPPLSVAEPSRLTDQSTYLPHQRRFAVAFENADFFFHCFFDGFPGVFGERSRFPFVGVAFETLLDGLDVAVF